MNRLLPTLAVTSSFSFYSYFACAEISEREEVKLFIDEMSSEHGFSKGELTQAFSKVKISKSILEAISRPAEAKPWYKYRPIFLTRDRIKQGVSFMHENLNTLKRVEEEFGVPREIVVAIIGVETRYGKHAGRYKVINSLSTLAFDYPKRSKFFRSELKHFLLLAREQKLDLHDVKGSYAGAMGIPQFISSSYRAYAIDYDGDDFVDIWNNPVDAIGSVGNYFVKHGWKPGQLIAMRARIGSDKHLALLTKGLEPHSSVNKLVEFDVSAENLPDTDEELKFLEYEIKDGFEYWLGFRNFYVITRYNHSALYAMAVYQLAEEIREKYAEKYGETAEK